MPHGFARHHSSWKTLRFLLLAALALQLLPPATARAEEKKPNILFLFADDQRPDTIGAFGHQIVQTPNIDKIVRNGFRFRQAYCMGSMSGAVCVPSRAMVNSGRTLFRINNSLKNIVTVPETFRNNGYETFGTGKWHNGGESFMRSFSKGSAVFLGGMSNHIEVPLIDLSADGNPINKRTGDGFSSTLFANAAIDFLKQHDGKKPFYAYVAFTTPHDPRQAPDGYIDMYQPDNMVLPKNFMPQHPFFNGWMTGRDETLAPWPRTPTIIRHQLAEYYGMITHMDHEIGRIMEVLEQSGLASNTIIVYAADHGLAMGSHGLLGKQSVYEHSMGTPMVFSGPGIPKGKSSDAFAYLLDIPATLLDVADIPADSAVEGQSLASIWKGEKKQIRDTVYTAYSKVMRGIRDERWKLIRFPHINKTVLFDLEKDPDELHDVSKLPENRTHVTRLMARLSTWQAKLDDPHPLTSKNPVSAEIDLTGRKRTPDRHQPDWIVRKYFKLEGWNDNGEYTPAQEQ